MEDIQTELLPELVELAGDEESSVRLAAFDTMINLMDIMDSGECVDRGQAAVSQQCRFKALSSSSDERLHIVVPLVMSVCDASSQVDEAIMAALSFQFGKLCSGLAGMTHVHIS